MILPSCGLRDFGIGIHDANVCLTNPSRPDQMTVSLSSKPTRLTFSITHLHEHHMSILCPALTSSLEDYPVLPKVFCMMVMVVMRHRLPSNVDHIAVFKAIDRFRHLATSDSSTAVHMPHDVRPQRPRVLPRHVGTCVDCCADGAAE